MPAPSSTDGLSRAIEELVVPSVVVIGLIIFFRAVYGAQEAGLAYLAMTILAFGGIYMKSKYWNFNYTLIFVLASAIFFVVAPSIESYLIPSEFANLSALVVLGFIYLIGVRIVDKY